MVLQFVGEYVAAFFENLYHLFDRGFLFLIKAEISDWAFLGIKSKTCGFRKITHKY